MLRPSTRASTTTGTALTNGTPYLIDCTWTANNEVAVDASGKEFTTNLIFSLS